MSLEPETDLVHTASVELVNDISELCRLGRLTHDILRPFAVSDGDLFRIDLVLEELATNIVKYGFNDQARHLIRFDFQLRRHGVEIKITDDGLPFDPFSGPGKQLPASLEEAQVGGLGVHLVKLYANACRYERSGGKNITTLTFNT
ncbi:MAG: ATP-binding protein [Pseudomonadota bacterium]